MKKKLFPMILIFLLGCFLFLMVCAEELYTVSGYAWLDSDFSSSDERESRLSGVPLTLLSVEDGETGTVYQAVTDENGSYSFTSLPSGNYRLRADYAGESYLAFPQNAGEIADGYAATAVFSLNSASPSEQVNIVVVNASPVVFSAYIDTNADGVRGKYDKPLPGAAVELIHGDTVLRSASTSQDGSVTLEAPAADCKACVTLPEGYAFSEPGSENAFASDTNMAALSLDGRGEYFIAAHPVGSLSGTVFEDVNNNGVWDEDEPGVPGVTVHLRSQKLGISLDAVSGENGRYSFGILKDATYSVTASLPDGLLFARYSKTGGDLRSIFSGETLEREFTVKNNTALTNKNIGVIQKGVISGKAFLDLNYNGLWDSEEPGYKGVTIEVTKATDGTVCGKTVTGADGSYAVENLRGGNYKVRAVLPNDGSIFSAVGSGTFENSNQFQQRSSRREYTVQTITISSGGNAAVLVGVALGASVSGTLFQDANYNGIFEKGEKSCGVLQVALLDENGEIAAQTSSSGKGLFTLDGIMPGQYTLKVQRKNGYGFTRCRAEQEGGSCIVSLQGNYGLSGLITVTMGETKTGLNAGMLPAATLSGKLMNDSDGDGLISAFEGGMTTARVLLVSQDAEADLSARVQSNGQFFFDGLMPGSYMLTYDLADYCEMVPGYQKEQSLQIKMGEEIKLPDASAVTLGSFAGIAANSQTGEPIEGVTLTIGEESVQSDESGAFEIANLRPGDYEITVTLPDGMIFAYPSDSDGLNWPCEPSVTQPIAWDALINRGEKQISAVLASSVRGCVWMDENKDGQQSDNEWVMEGLTLELWRDDCDAPSAVAVSDGNGFLFSNVRPGQYSVRFVLPEQSEPANDSRSTFTAQNGSMVQSGIAVQQGSQVSGLSTGLVSLTSIGGQILLEVEGERTPLSGASLSLKQNGVSVSSVLSDENGTYTFSGLWPGEYTVECAEPSGTVFVRADDENYADEPLFIVKEAQGIGSSDFISLQMAQHQLRHDILLIKPGKVGDQAWLDENKNGLIDAGEPFLCGVKVALTQNGDVRYETVTDEQGYYFFGDVYPGTYTLQASAYDALCITDRVEYLAIISSCLTSGDGANAQSDPFPVESGSINADMNLGYQLRDGAVLPEQAVQKAVRDWSEIHHNMVDGIVR